MIGANYLGSAYLGQSSLQVVIELTETKPSQYLVLTYNDVGILSSYNILPYIPPELPTPILMLSQNQLHIYDPNIEAYMRGKVHNFIDIREQQILSMFGTITNLVTIIQSSPLSIGQADFIDIYQQESVIIKGNKSVVDVSNQGDINLRNHSKANTIEVL